MCHVHQSANYPASRHRLATGETGIARERAKITTCNGTVNPCGIGTSPPPLQIGLSPEERTEKYFTIFLVTHLWYFEKRWHHVRFACFSIQKILRNPVHHVIKHIS